MAAARAPEQDGYEWGYRIIRADLMRQLGVGKAETWREKADQEFGHIPPVDPTA